MKGKKQFLRAMTTLATFGPLLWILHTRAEEEGGEIKVMKLWQGQSKKCLLSTWLKRQALIKSQPHSSLPMVVGGVCVDLTNKSILC